MNITKKMGLSPAQIVQELDRHIIGQTNAKKAVAVALRNRYRRSYVEEPLKSEIMPKNILMIGSTGVGKTEIARRLAKLAEAPFIKIEATKFTEVGYVGRDVESIIRDLVDIAIHSQREKAAEIVKSKAREKAIERILDSVVGENASPETKTKFNQKLISGELNNTEIEINVKDTPPSMGNSFDIPGIPGASMGVLNISDILGKTFGSGRMKQKKLSVEEAMKVIILEETEKLIDEELIISKALKTVENNGIVFLDEIDKITSRTENRAGEVSREGVQRDLLPLIEGTSVATKYGPVKTDHILFITSGAFHLSKPSDLLPELQGRLPIRVEMTSLSKNDMVRILNEPENSLIKQYIALFNTEGVELVINEQAINAIAEYATRFNKEIENIGARRLHTILENILEEISFNAGTDGKTQIIINEEFVHQRLAGFIQNVDMAKFIL
ncbi:MAG: ATP-dependent protease ATPase subunit HslU [Rickettsiaceae bacterium]|nr:ATP-dependent protease ATPase subunit HslU [Rickettsiaceae bacterium]